MTNWIHLCIDMQRMFSEDTPWHVPWMAAVSPAVVELSGHAPHKTIFTRFVPPENADAVPGAWQDYYQKWKTMTLGQIDRRLVDIVPTLQRFVPPGRYFDKMTYSPWVDGRLHNTPRREGLDTVVVSGGETDVCVMAATLGAIDLGYHVKLLRDAVCSGADDTHEAALALLGRRFSVQLEVLQTEEFLRRL